MKKLLIFGLMIRIVFLPFCVASAQIIGEDTETMHFDKASLEKGLHWFSRDKALMLVISPKLFNIEVNLTVNTYKIDGLAFPKGWQAVSKIYEFSFSSAAQLNYQHQTIMQIFANSDIMDLKKIFKWNETVGQWEQIDSSSRDLKSARAKIALSGGKYVMLKNDKIMEFGAASWYKYKNCDCAASPDYPKGTKLKVTNLENGKSVIVKINDWGPERDKHPDRVIDLDKTAFKKLGYLSRGILKMVKVEKI
ncbi:MAG: septal ring lytic transglycosylase RlpA family protein [Candidatus Falkowbacteria bacterium]